MDDFIYVLLFVGWIAYSIFSAVQKKKQKELKKKPAPEQFPMPEVIEPEKPTRSVFEEIFGEGQFGKFEESHEPEPVYEEAKRRPLVHMRKEVDHDTDTMILTHLSQDETWNKASEKELQSEVEDVVKQKESFDLRKAVIYAAILQRPYN